MSDQQWMSARRTKELVAQLVPDGRGTRALCARLRDGLITSRAKRLFGGESPTEDAEIPALFWWAFSTTAPGQNWATGDFEAGLSHNTEWRAYGVEFDRKGVLEMLGLTEEPTTEKPEPPLEDKGGRPRAEWWEDLWIAVCTQLYVGDLQPKNAADIQRAMQGWLIDKGFDAAESTLKPRARKLWKAINEKGKNL